MMLIKPLIYTVCDTGYRDLYGDAFERSARAAGHDVRIFCTDRLAVSMADKVELLGWRFAMLPDLLKVYGAAMMLDIDSVVQRPAEVDDEYDFGLFLRPEQPDERVKTLCSIVYCTDRAMDFAQEIATNLASAWFEDQAIVWRAYDRMKDRYKVKRFGEDFISWRNANAAIFTGKGAVKHGPAFARLTERYAAA